MTGTGAVAIAAAAAIPGTVVQGIVGAQKNRPIRFGHPSGVLEMGVEAGRWAQLGSSPKCK